MCVRQYVAVTARIAHSPPIHALFQRPHQSCRRSSNPSHLESSSHAHSALIRTMQTVSASTPHLLLRGIARYCCIC